MAGEAILKSAKGFYKLPIMRQIGLMVGLAASIAIGFQVVLWSKDPNYRPLYSQLTLQQTNEILDTLQANGIEYKVDRQSGSVLVPSDEIFNARFKLAGVGIPGDNNVGFEMFDKDSGLGTSRFMESARYKRALEGELAKTITSLKNVKAARVHLAIPKEAIFVNDKLKPTASVFLDLNVEDDMTKKQVLAIQQLVAASIPKLTSKEVSVIDQNGTLLSTNNLSPEYDISNERLQYIRNLEKNYENNILNLLAPLVGRDNVKASVSAAVDFTDFEKTEENYIPSRDSIRSEHVVNEIEQPDKASGVPGALTNKVPKNQSEPDSAGLLSEVKTKQATRNFEVGKQISHSKHNIGDVQRLSIGVVIDNITKKDSNGKDVSMPLNKREISDITMLIKNAVGFSAERGDQISVVNIPFLKKIETEEVLPLPIWKQEWALTMLKKIISGIFILILVFFVLRPILKLLANKETLGKEGELMPAMQLPDGTFVRNSENVIPNVKKPAEMSELQQMADEDPKKIALVMKSWVGDNKS